MRKKQIRNEILLFASLIIIFFIGLGGTSKEYAAKCYNCSQQNHLTCTNKQAVKVDNSTHKLICCDNVYDFPGTEAHTMIKVGQGGVCYKCSKCTYTTSHTYGNWRQYSSTQHDKVCSGCGIYAYRADHYDNNSDGKCDACGYVMSVDKTPKIDSVKINNGATTTKNLEVIMEIKATNVSKIYVSNTNDIPVVDDIAWKEYKLYTKHKLTWQNGAKTVYVWGKDEEENMTLATTASIILDRRYSLSLKNNQKYLGRLEPASKYAIKADDGGWQWQDSNMFTNLVPATVYTFKTQLYDVVGITGDSEELKLRAVYDKDGKLYIEYIN